MGNNYFEKRNLYSDDDLIDAYLKYGSQIKAAEHLEVSRETVARACRRNNIALTGRRNNGKGRGKGYNGGGSPIKVTDAELIEEAKTMSRYEIAVKHRMNPCTVDGRLRRLKISAVPGVSTGGSKWYKRAMIYGADCYDDSITLASVYERDKGICQICGKPTSLTARNRRHVLGEYPSVDHIVPLSKGGAHTWENVQLAHMACNAKKCDKIQEAAWQI